MADQKDTLPEGTDEIISGASATGTGREQRLEPVPTTRAGEANARDRVMGKVRDGGNRLADTAAEKTRGLVGQGLERSSEALANVSKLVGGTVDGLEERLGPEYGDYARKAAASIEDVANRLAAKDPDELIDDTREFVRKSPGVALAGAAIVGFALARLVKTGLDSGKQGDRGKRRSDDSDA